MTEDVWVQCAQIRARSAQLRWWAGLNREVSQVLRERAVETRLRAEQLRTPTRERAP